MGAEVGRFERFVFLYFAFILSSILFLFFGTVIFWSFWKLKVTFPFSTDTVTLYLNVS